jgi:hypothetical protein
MSSSRLAIGLIGFIGICSSATPARAQRYGDWTPALRSLPLDAAALGMPGRAFLEYSRSDQVSWLATGGLRLGQGVLRASFGQGWRQQILGVGYSSPVAQQSVGVLGTLGAGVDLTGGYDFSSYAMYDSRAVRLSVPLSIRWGSPSRVSLTPYVAPYGEVGHGRILHANCHDFTCTGPVTVYDGQARAVGLAAGFQLTAWRLGLEAGLRDALMSLDVPRRYQLTVGFRLHF